MWFILWSCCAVRPMCRQQLQAALTVVETGLSKLQSSDRCDSGASTTTGGGMISTSSTAAVASSSISPSSSLPTLPHFHDVLLLRIQAQLLLALSDANRSVAVLGSAVRRLSSARRAAEERRSSAAGIAAELLQEQEAQVGGWVGGDPPAAGLRMAQE